MKVCMLIWDYWPGHEGGSERQCRRVARRLVQKGIECEVVTGRASWKLPVAEIDSGVRITRIGWFCPVANAVARCVQSMERAARALFSPRAENMSRFERNAFAVRFWLMLPFMWVARLAFVRALEGMAGKGRLRADVVHLHEPSWLAGVAEWLAPQMKAVVLAQEATFPSLPVIGYDVPFAARWRRLRLKPRYLAMAPYLKNDLVRNGIPEERIELLPNGVELPGNPVDVAENSDVLYVGNFSQGSHQKAFDVLLEAWALVHRKMPSTKLYCAGDGDASAWKLYAKKLGCEDSVIFAGQVQDIDSCYRKAALFVLPSRVEGISNALLEALSWGLPVVVSDIPGNVAVVKHDESGLVVPVGDSKALAENIMKLLADGEKRREMGRKGRDLIASRYEIGIVVDKLIEICGRTTKEKPAQ